LALPTTKPTFFRGPRKSYPSSKRDKVNNINQQSRRRVNLFRWIRKSSAATATFLFEPNAAADDRMIESILFEMSIVHQGAFCFNSPKLKLTRIGRNHCKKDCTCRVRTMNRLIICIDEPKQRFKA